jgi:hypothetical protein
MQMWTGHTTESETASAARARVGGGQETANNSIRSTRVAVCAMMLAATLWVSACGGGGGSIDQSRTSSATQPVKSGTVSLLDDNGTNTLPDGSTGVVRLTYDSPKWSQAVSAPASDAGATLIGLQLRILTGGDDLRGDSDNATVVIHYANVGDVGYQNINQSQHWNNWEPQTVALVPIPSSTTVGDVQSITILVNFFGGVGSDNWDIARVTLYAAFLQ